MTWIGRAGHKEGMAG